MPWNDRPASVMESANSRPKIVMKRLDTVNLQKYYRYTLKT